MTIEYCQCKTNLFIFTKINEIQEKKKLINQTFVYNPSHIECNVSCLWSNHLLFGGISEVNCS